MAPAVPKIIWDRCAAVATRYRLTIKSTEMIETITKTAIRAMFIRSKIRYRDLPKSISPRASQPTENRRRWTPYSLHLITARLPCSLLPTARTRPQPGRGTFKHKRGETDWPSHRSGGNDHGFNSPSRLICEVTFVYRRTATPRRNHDFRARAAAALPTGTSQERWLRREPADSPTTTLTFHSASSPIRARDPSPRPAASPNSADFPVGEFPQAPPRLVESPLPPSPSPTGRNPVAQGNAPRLPTPRKPRPEGAEYGNGTTAPDDACPMPPAIR